MHILFLTTEFPEVTPHSGGIATYTKRISQSLIRSGHTVSVVIAGSKNKQYTRDSIQITEFKAPNLFEYIDSSEIKKSVRTMRLLFTALRFKFVVLQINHRNKVDIVQTPNYLFPGLFLANSRNFPLVCRVSSYSPLLRSAFGSKRTAIGTVEDYFEYKLISKSNGSFVPSYYIKNIFKNFENLDLEYIPTPTEELLKQEIDDRYYQEITKIIKDGKYLLHFGNMSKIKGTDLFTEIIPKVLKNHNNVYFVFIGNDCGYRNIILKENSDFNNKIIFLPYIDKKYLYPILKNAYSVIIPSRVDNLPNNCLEAIAFSVPVIGTKHSSLEELILDKKTGFLAQNQSSEDISDKINLLLDQRPDEYKQMKNATCKLYKQLLHEKREDILVRYYNKLIRDFNEI